MQNLIRISGLVKSQNISNLFQIYLSSYLCPHYCKNQKPLNRIKDQLREASNILNTFLADEKQLASIEKSVELMVACIQNGGKIFSCGNGGSMADAMHFAEELTGRFREDRKALPAISISDPTHITCTANDYGFEHIFSRYISALGKPGDVLLALSTSGNSSNILKALEVSKELGIQTVALTGKDGGKAAELADIEIRAPFSKYSDRTQEIHIKVIHVMIDGIEQHFKK